MGVGIVRLPPASQTDRARAVSAAEGLPPVGSEWVRLDDAVLVWGESDEAARSRGLRVEEPAVQPAPKDLRLVTQVGRVFEQTYPDVPVVLDKGRYLVVQLDERHRQIDASEAACYKVRPFRPGETVFRTVSPPARAPDPSTQALVDQVSRGWLEGYLTRFADFPTRFSMSDEFAAAAAWARDELERLGFTAQLVPISVRTEASMNVVADRLGGGPEPRALVIVCAHLDSVNSFDQSPAAAAPGADDNASGAAALLEIARTLSGHRPAHDLRMILFGGEEQGLYGSLQYVEGVPESERRRVRAVINMDMVATRNTPAASVLLEGAPLSQALIDELAAAASSYTSLLVQESTDPARSDHVPFIDADMPAVLTIEGADSGNGNVHTADDTLAHIDYELALEIVRMNVATAATALGHLEM